MNKKLTVIIAVSLMIFLIGACATEKVAKKEQNSPTSAPLKTKVTIAEFAEIFLYAPLYIAEEKGFFDKEGLEVTIFPAGGLDKTWAAVLSGSAQFGVADPLITAISGEKGQSGVVVANVVRGVPIWAVT